MVMVIASSLFNGNCLQMIINLSFVCLEALMFAKKKSLQKLKKLFNHHHTFFPSTALVISKLLLLFSHKPKINYN